MTALVTITLTWENTTALVVGSAAFLAAAGYLVRTVFKAARFVRRHLTSIRDDLETARGFVEHELSHNGGSSIKDDVYGIAVSVGKLTRDVAELRNDLDRHLDERTRR